MAAEILMAAESAAVTLDDGIPYMIEGGRTLAHADHPIVTGCPNLWKPLQVHYSTDEPVAPETPQAVQPDPKAVRAWAADQGIDVPAKGRIPADVNEAYQAAHQGV